MLCAVYQLGLTGYNEADSLQKELLEKRANGEIPDTLLLLEHPPTITTGRAGQPENVLVSREQLEREGINLVSVDRGGDATYHGPGQLVAYPIIDLRDRNRDARRYVRDLEEVIIRTLGDFDITASRDQSHAGVWVENEEMAAIGVSVRQWVTRHGFALNVNTDLRPFSFINPCGFTDRGATSLSRLLARDVSVTAVTERLVARFAEVFGAQLEWAEGSPPGAGRLPSWFKQKPAGPEVMGSMAKLLGDLRLHTICESAHCPNIGGCFSRKTATFLILGDVCTRRCTFCAVKKGRPLPVDDAEPRHLLEAVEKLGLRYVVLTSVTRDDLPDGGAAHFARAISALRGGKGSTTVEVLIPDFLGSATALAVVAGAGPEVINHNVETVPRLYHGVRPQADYRRSVKLLAAAKEMNPQVVTKSGMMVGLGETREEVVAVMRDLKKADCDLLTIGQYLQPSPKHHPVVSFFTPEEFDEYRTIGKELGFTEVASSPLVRSSYQAAELYKKVVSSMDKTGPATH